MFVIYTFGSENKSIKLGKIFKILYLYGIINAVFCICQFALKSTILPDYILNGESVYQANTYYGTFVRSSGFFFSGLDVGILLVFTLSYLIVLDCGLLIKKILVSGLLIFAIYTTKTRNVYLLLLYLNLYFFIFHTNKIQTNNKIKFFMIITTIISIIVVFFASFAGEGKLINNIFSGNSSVIRLLSWGKWVEKFMAQNPIIILFGNCSSQRLGLTTDNMYMDYLSSFGLIGLILLIRLFIKIMKLLAVRISKKSYIMTSFITCLFPFGVINLPATFFMIYLPFLTTVCIEESNDKPDNEVN